MPYKRLVNSKHQLKKIRDLVFEDSKYKPLAKFKGANWLLDGLLSSLKESIILRDQLQCKSVVRALEIALIDKDSV